MKVTEVRGHHTTEMQSKRSRIREGITFCLGLAMACGIGRIHYVQEGETLWDIASGIASDSDDIRQVVYELQTVNNISGTEDLHPGQRLIIKF